MKYLADEPDFNKDERISWYVNFLTIYQVMLSFLLTVHMINVKLYTGRCHFFKRLMIKGARHVIFFGLPEHPTFYSDIVNSLNNMGKTRVDFDLESPASCLSIFTKYETHCLERIVGTSHCEHIINSDKQVFLFNT